MLISAYMCTIDQHTCAKVIYVPLISWDLLFCLVWENHNGIIESTNKYIQHGDFLEIFYGDNNICLGVVGEVNKLTITLW